MYPSCPVQSHGEIKKERDINRKITIKFSMYFLSLGLSNHAHTDNRIWKNNVGASALAFVYKPWDGDERATGFLGHALGSPTGGAGGEAEGEVTLQCHLNRGLRWPLGNSEAQMTIQNGPELWQVSWTLCHQANQSLDGGYPGRVLNQGNPW